MKPGRSYSIVILFVLVYLANQSAAQTVNGTNATLLPRNMNGPALLRNLRECSCPWPGLVNRQAYDNCTMKANSSSGVIFKRMCRFDCAMKYMSYLNGTTMNYTFLATRFKGAAKSLSAAADNATSYCASYVENFNNSIPIPQAPPGVSVCNPKGLLAWVCIRQQFVIQTCNISGKDPKCAENFARLKTLTPLNLLLN
ncbi:uncharacterized protein LOC135947882 [Cloeon dipterum]|uniref:uncharacterized protein LOC135947882 n=1 Tax=Cloeon dipterum TaxID=197152 RepID=UPI00321FABAB